MAFKSKAQVALDKIDRGEIPDREYDYFNPPHGGRPPSDMFVSMQTLKYCAQERARMSNPRAIKEFDYRMTQRYGTYWKYTISPEASPAAKDKGRKAGKEMAK